MRGVALSRLESYLYNRQQYVHFAGCGSEYMTMECRVPQGSVLVPKLFILYINDICEVSELLHFVLFSDDTNLFCSSDYLITLSNDVETEMINIDKLSLNLEKTKFMVFSTKKTDKIQLPLRGVNIEKVSAIRFLGVVTDEALTWKSHTAHIKNKVLKNIFILNKVKYIFHCKTMRMFYCSLILPYFSYCVEVWGNTYVSNRNSLNLCQNQT